MGSHFLFFILTDRAAPEAVAKIDEPRVERRKGGCSCVVGVAYLFIHQPVARQPTSLCQ